VALNAAAVIAAMALPKMVYHRRAGAKVATFLAKMRAS